MAKRGWNTSTPVGHGHVLGSGIFVGTLPTPRIAGLSAGEIGAESMGTQEYAPICLAPIRGS